MINVPLPTKKLKLLALASPKAKEVDIISQRKRSTSAKWVAMTNGKPVCPIMGTKEDVFEYMKLHSDIHYNVAKLHVVGDRELIAKINKMFV